MHQRNSYLIKPQKLNKHPETTCSWQGIHELLKYRPSWFERDEIFFATYIINSDPVFKVLNEKHITL